MIRISTFLNCFLPFGLLCIILSISSLTHAEDLLQIFAAIQNHDPAWKTKEYEYQAGIQAKGKGRAYLLPALMLGGEHKEVTHKPDCGNSEDPGCSEVESEYSSSIYQLQFKQTLFDMEDWYTWQQGKAFAEKAEIEYQGAMQNNLYNTAVLYFDVLRTQEDFYLAQAEKDALATQLKEIQTKANVGVANQTEVLETQASADLAMVNHITVLGYLKVAREKLITHTGIEKPTVMALSQDFPIQHLVPFDEQLWVNKAKENSPNLLALEQAIDLAHKSYRKQSAAAYPKVDFFASIAEQDQDGGSFIINGRTESVGIQVSIPLFAGMGDHYASKEYKMKYFQTSEDAEAQTRELIQIVKNRFRSIYTDVLTVEAQRNALNSSERALRAVKAEYDAGSRNMIDVLNAQQRLFDAKRALSHARYNYLLDRLQLKLFVGELTIADLTVVNQWLVIDDTLMDLNTIP